jgi:hypothetical protein
MTNLLSGLASPAPQPSSAHDSPLQTGRPREVEANWTQVQKRRLALPLGCEIYFGDPLVRLARTPAWIKPPSSPFVIDEL